MMTDAEKRVADALVNAWNAFCALPVDHQDERVEFRYGVHALQHMIYARPTLRAINAQIAPEGAVTNCHGIGHTGCGQCTFCSPPPTVAPHVATPPPAWPGHPFEGEMFADFKARTAPASDGAAA